MTKLEQNLMRLIYAVGKFQKQPKFTKGCSNISPTQVKLFEIVRPNEKITMNEIAKGLGSSKGATSILVNKLVKKKQLTRTYDKNDRRLIYISLTKDGEKAYRSYLECKHKVLSSITECLADHEHDKCIAVLDSLVEHFEKNLKN